MQQNVDEQIRLIAIFQISLCYTVTSLTFFLHLLLSIQTKTSHLLLTIMPPQSSFL